MKCRKQSTFQEVMFDVRINYIFNRDINFVENNFHIILLYNLSISLRISLNKYWELT